MLIRRPFVVALLLGAGWVIGREAGHRSLDLLDMGAQAASVWWQDRGRADRGALKGVAP